MAVNRSSLSAGAVIRAILLEDAEVAARVNKVFPVVADSATLPYIVYRRIAFSTKPQKSGHPGADEIQMEILCFTARYSEGVELAEAVRSALDFQNAEGEGLRLRGCFLCESEEGWENDAFVQQLVFKVMI